MLIATVGIFWYLVINDYNLSIFSMLLGIVLGAVLGYCVDVLGTGLLKDDMIQYVLLEEKDIVAMCDIDNEKTFAKLENVDNKSVCKVIFIDSETGEEQSIVGSVSIETISEDETAHMDVYAAEFSEAYKALFLVTRPPKVKKVVLYVPQNGCVYNAD